MVYCLVSNQNRYDFIIQGAGASGLWLAHALNEMELLKNKRLLIVEGDLNKGDDRTWCFWTQATDESFPFVDTRWSSLWVQKEQQSILPYRYHHARSSAFYRWVKETLVKNPNVHWHHGWVTAVVEQDCCVMVDLDGETVETEYFFGSGNSLSTRWKSDISFWQSFVGWRIRFQSGESGWNSDRATLMDFSIDSGETTRFLYVLPFTENEGLIEVTQFDSECLTVELGEKLLKEICDLKGWKVDVLEVECDAIPMSSKYSVVDASYSLGSRVVDIGVKAGVLKPTTGYGFLTMRNHAMEIAKAIKFHLPIPKVYRKKRFRFYDDLLLQILRNSPQKGKPIFERLFHRQPARRILKFLDEKTSLWEEVCIFSCLQVTWFLKAVLHYERK